MFQRHIQHIFNDMLRITLPITITPTSIIDYQGTLKNPRQSKIVGKLTIFCSEVSNQTQVYLQVTI